MTEVYVEKTIMIEGHNQLQDEKDVASCSFVNNTGKCLDLAWQEAQSI